MPRVVIADHLLRRKSPLTIVVGEKAENYNVTTAVELIKILQEIFKKESPTIEPPSKDLESYLAGMAKLDNEIGNNEYIKSDIISIGEPATNIISSKIMDEFKLHNELKKRASIALGMMSKNKKLRVLITAKNAEFLSNITKEFIKKLKSNTALTEETIYTTDLDRSVQALPRLYDHYYGSTVCDDPERSALEDFLKYRKEGFINNFKEMPIPELNHFEQYAFANYLYHEAHTCFIFENYVGCILTCATCLEHLLKTFIQNHICTKNEKAHELLEEIAILVDQMELGAVERLTKRMGIVQSLKDNIQDFSNRLNALIQTRNKYVHADRDRLYLAVVEKLNIPPEKAREFRADTLTAELSREEAKTCLALLKETIIFVDKLHTNNAER